MADPIEEAARLLGVDAGELRKLRAQQDRDELKGIFREVLDELLAGPAGDEDDDDDLRTAAEKAAAGKKPRPKPKDDDAADDDPIPIVQSLAARLGLVGDSKSDAA